MVAKGIILSGVCGLLCRIPSEKGNSFAGQVHSIDMNFDSFAPSQARAEAHLNHCVQL